jgi:hypothetical protein
VVEVSSDDSDIDDEYETLHPKLVGWDNGRSNLALIQDPFKEQQDLITFN